MVLQCQLTLLLVVLTVGTKTTAGFLLSGSQCVAPPPCTCSGTNYIRCESKSLTDIPHFSSVTAKDFTSSFYIYLQSNKLTSISANAFRNLSSVNTSSIYFFVTYNKISSIDIAAFSGIENKTEYLDLRNNNLTSLPSVLHTLSKLKELRMEGNPIVSLDSSTLLLLSSHLTTFGFDMAKFNVWPADLNKLQHLQKLIITHVPLNHIPLNAFAGFASGLTELSLSNTQLPRIPSAVCHLQHLKSLTFNNNAALESNTTLFEPCSHKLAHLTTLQLNNNNLYAFPDVIHSFPSLTYLYLSGNKIRFVHTNVIPFVNDLHSLYLHNNQLTHIPFAFNKLKNLTTLYLSGNQISTIEDRDLVGLTKLQDLYIYSNPIMYIAPHAFKNNVQLYDLLMRYTRLHLVPEAVRYLPRLTQLNFDGNHVDCDCRMSYLKGWNVTAVTTFTGNCENQQTLTIKQYLSTQLQSCP